MSNQEKLYKKLKNHPNSATFEDIDKLLHWCGFELRRVHGSHHIYKHAEYAQLVTVPHHKPLKTVYVKQVLALFERFYDFDKT